MEVLNVGIIAKHSLLLHLLHGALCKILCQVLVKKMKNIIASIFREFTFYWSGVGNWI